MKPRDGPVAVLQGLEVTYLLGFVLSSVVAQGLVMQESSAASYSQRRMQELPVHQKIPSIQTGVCCNSASTLILSVATIWGAEGFSSVTCSHRAGNLPPFHCGTQPWGHLQALSCHGPLHQHPLEETWGFIFLVAFLTPHNLQYNSVTPSH